MSGSNKKIFFLMYGIAFLFLMFLFFEKNAFANPVFMPVDYETIYKCENSPESKGICNQFKLYGIDGVNGGLHDVLLKTVSAIQKFVDPQSQGYYLLPDIGGVKVLLGENASDGIVTYTLLTVHNGKLMGHQIIGEYNAETNSINDFRIDKNYTIYTYVRKSGGGIKSPRKLSNIYQVGVDGGIKKIK